MAQNLKIREKEKKGEREGGGNRGRDRARERKYILVVYATQLEVFCYGSAHGEVHYYLCFDILIFNTIRTKS